MAVSEDDGRTDTSERTVLVKAATTKDLKAVKKNGEQAEVSALVTQEKKAKHEPHYHDNEKQRNSDDITEIHGRHTLGLTFRLAPRVVASCKRRFAISSAKSFEMARSSVPR
jgi:hypothetical protein